MSFLVDTNVFSEQLKPKPDSQVIDWIQENEANLYLSTVSLGEIRRGIERFDEGKRKRQYQHWLTQLSETMRGNILSYNRSVAHVWGQMQAAMEREGFAASAFDGLIAATAIRHGLTLVTRNTRDFQHTGATLLNPFSENCS